jgi:hypothetical protein
MFNWFFAVWQGKMLILLLGVSKMRKSILILVVALFAISMSVEVMAAAGECDGTGQQLKDGSGCGQAQGECDGSGSGKGECDGSGEGQGKGKRQGERDGQGNGKGCGKGNGQGKGCQG